MRYIFFPHAVLMKSLNAGLVSVPKQSLTLLCDPCTKANTFTKCLLNYNPRRYRRPKYLKKHPPTREAKFDYSGDLLKQGKIDGSKLHYAYSEVKELESAPEDVRKLFTLDFAEGNAVTDHRLAEISAHIESKLGPDCELEKQIAVATIGLRNEMEHCMMLKKDTRAKSRLVERIQYRRKKLTELRKKDHERFVWILNELRIKYIRPVTNYVTPTKNQLRRQAVIDETNKLKAQKTEELRQTFKRELEEFYAYKRVKMEEIERDMEELGLTDMQIQEAIQKSIVEPEPDYRVMSRLEKFLYEEKKEKEAKKWTYVRELEE